MRKLSIVLGSLLIFALSTAATADAFTGVVNDSGVRVRAAPSRSSRIVKTLFAGQEVDVVASARGEVVGGSGLWYKLPSGGWVHSSLISEGSSVPAPGAPFSGRWVDVNISTQTATAMEGDQVVYTAGVTTGKPGFPTPRGTFSIVRRLASTDMDSTTVGIPRDSPHGYFQPNVQFTQYFDFEGDALHGNYWQPESVFGNTPTSHGCVGMRNSDAAFFWDFASIGTPVVIHD